MSSVLITTEKVMWRAVRFEYGDKVNPPFSPVYFRLTDWSSDLTTGPDGGTYTSTPSMEVKLPKNTSTLSEQAAQVMLPLVSGGFTDLCSRGEPFSAIWVTIWEITAPPSGDTSAPSILMVYRGRVSRIVRNHLGRHEEVLFEVLNDKGRLRAPFGFAAGLHCVWNFTGTGCNLTGGMPPLLQNGLVTAINQRNMTMTGVTAGPPGAPDRYYQRGYCLLNGLYIQIFDWDPTVPTNFIMNRQPPAAWVGQTVVVAPGCDKTIETCRARWNNEQHFGGFGYGIPAYNPLYEQPPQ